MKRIIVICEGQTEAAFCETILQPYFSNKDVSLAYPLIKHSGGGIVSWNILCNQITTTLKHDRSAFVTTFIDYYGLKPKHQFPRWKEAEAIPDKYGRMVAIEAAMKNSIDAELQHRFLPYIQLHEFESLLFSKESAIVDLIPDELLIGKAELEELMVLYPNPEMINNAPETSPSHRLKKIIKGYSKVLHGELICEGIGLDQLRLKCPHFNEWVSCMERIQIVI